MNVSQISIARFHHFHLARQLEKHGLLEALYTGYPRFKLSDEPGYHLAKSSFSLAASPIHGTGENWTGSMEMA